jgi:NADH-quinone oxidoreductase subunit J
VLGVGVFAVLAAAIVTSTESVVRRGEGLSVTEASDPDANIRQIARSIFGDYVFAFEVVSILLLVAVVGTVLLTRRQRRDGMVSK